MGDFSTGGQDAQLLGHPPEGRTPRRPPLTVLDRASAAEFSGTNAPKHAGQRWRLAQRADGAYCGSMPGVRYHNIYDDDAVLFPSDGGCATPRSSGPTRAHGGTRDWEGWWSLTSSMGSGGSVRRCFGAFVALPPSKHLMGGEK